jgi:hypothetical protein
MTTLLESLRAHDAHMVDAYRLAVERVSDDLDRSQLAQFMADHERHLRELDAVANELRVPGEKTSRLVPFKLRVLAAFGLRALFAALRGCDARAHALYTRAGARADLPSAALDVLARAAADEARHRAWLSDRLAPTHAQGDVQT